MKVEEHHTSFSIFGAVQSPSPLFCIVAFIVIQFSGEYDEPFDVIRWFNSTRQFCNCKGCSKINDIINVVEFHRRGTLFNIALVRRERPSILHLWSWGIFFLAEV